MSHGTHSIPIPFQPPLSLLGKGKGALLLCVLCLLCALCAGCSDDKDDAPFPDLITEMADCPTDGEGRLLTIVLDDDTRLTLTNPQTGLKANATYRALADYTLSDGKATLYGLKSCPFLRDSTAVGQCDPVNVASLWMTRRYLNLHLLPKTQGQAAHTWGYITDSIRSRHAYLRLHHRQGSDPTAYTADQYASLPLEDIEADTLTFRIETFAGMKTWTLTK